MCRLAFRTPIRVPEQQVLEGASSGSSVPGHARHRRLDATRRLFGGGTRRQQARFLPQGVRKARWKSACLVMDGTLALINNGRYTSRRMMDGAENWVLMSFPTFTAAPAPTRNVNSSSRESLETDAGGPTEGARSRRTPLQEAQQTRSACDPQDKARRSARRLAGPMASDQWELRLPGDRRWMRDPPI